MLHNLQNVAKTHINETISLVLIFFELPLGFNCQSQEVLPMHIMYRTRYYHRHCIGCCPKGERKGGVKKKKYRKKKFEGQKKKRASTRRKSEQSGSGSPDRADQWGCALTTCSNSPTDNLKLNSTPSPLTPCTCFVLKVLPCHLTPTSPCK